jgi:uncharacterized protein (DUF433 family)
MDRIELNSEIMTGKPVIKGTRLTVELILKLLSQGQNLDVIIETYPYITKEDILACIQYATNLMEHEKVFPLKHKIIA